MVFHSKPDNFFKGLMGVIILIIAAVTLTPILLDSKMPLSALILLIFTFLLACGLVLVSMYLIKYTFKAEYLDVFGGYLRSRIPYDKITEVAISKDIYTGYRILNKKEAIEVFYSTGMFGSVKISPDNQELFLEELQERCPNLKVSL